jgi:putative ABC transport system ATP-binding protein
MPKGNGTIIRMQGIRKVYDTGKVKVEALRGIDLEVKHGTFAAIIGPSGSGKSTLMNILGCLDVPSDGIYEFQGERVDGLHHNRLAEIRNERVGFVFQNFNLLPYATALENVELPLIFKGVNTRERRQRATELLERVGLGERTKHAAIELSGGEMQRVAIARALANSPSLILADEPTGNLDTGSGAEIIKLFEELWHAGHTILIITHDPNIPKRTERVFHIKDGLLTEKTNGA